VNGTAYDVVVSPDGAVQQVQSAAPVVSAAGTGESIPSPLSGNIMACNVVEGQQVEAGDVILVMEAMKMETEVRAPVTGTIATVVAKVGDAVQVGDTLVVMS